MCSTLAAAVVLWGVRIEAGDWPQFLGPTGDNVARGEKLARRWPAGGPRVLWKTPVGVGFGGPCIRDGRVYILDRRNNMFDVLRCLDLESGEELWRKAYHSPGKLNYNGSRSTPAADDTHVFTIGPFGQLRCVSMKTHRPVWERHLLKEFGTKRPFFGCSQSPLVHKKMVIAAPLSDKTGVAAFDKLTGKLVWESKPFGPMRYSSPRCVTVGGVEQVVVMSLTHVAGVDVRDGALLWSYGGYRCSIPTAEPAFAGPGRFFVTGGYGAGSVMIQVDREENGFAVRELFRLKKLGSQVHVPLLYGRHLYAQCNTKSRKDGLACLDLTGAVKWQRKNPTHFDWGGHILAGDLMLMMDGGSGVLRLLEPDPSGYRELARAKVLSGKQIWAPMALSGGRLVLRDQKQLKCLVIGERP